MLKFFTSFIVVVCVGCSSPPTPPIVDGKQRQPINDENISKDQEALISPGNRIILRPTNISSTALLPKSKLFHLHFAPNDTTVRLHSNELKLLPWWLSKAQRIEVRGRTDGQNPSDADEKLALNRALAVQGYLLEQKVSPTLISINYVSAGDYVADNCLEIGKKKNRRVDIEIFTS